MTDVFPAMTDMRGGPEAPARARHECSAARACRLTLRTAGRAPILASASADGILLLPAGRIVQVEWLRTAALRPSVRLDASVILPDHLHGIVLLDGTVSLGAMVAGLKSASAARINRLRATPGAAVWQRGYGAAILRPADVAAARAWLLANPSRWLARELPGR